MIQSALLTAVAALGRFRGRSDGELVRWFDRILHRRRVDFVRADQRRAARVGSV